jgi:hypothetical protein
MTGFGSGHTPQLFDVDGDGVSEILLGRTTCRADGSILWEIDPEQFSPSQIDHVDSLAVADVNEDGRLEVAVGNAASVFDALSGQLLWQRPDLVTHGQQLRVARIRDDVPGLQILVGNSHSRDVFVFSAEGDLLFDMPYSGMLCPIAWQGSGLQQISLGPVVRDGHAAEVASLSFEKAAATAGCRWPMDDPDTWGHTMVCDVDGDGLEEVVWVNKACLAVFRNPEPPESPVGVVRDETYWTHIANATRY